MENIKFNHQFYVDDGLLIARSHEILNQLFSITKKYSKLTKVQINPKKTFHTATTSNTPSLKHRKTQITKIQPSAPFKYLGLPISADLNTKGILASEKKKILDLTKLILSKRYLSTSNHIKLINTIALGPIKYKMQFLSFNKEALKDIFFTICEYLSRSANTPITSDKQY